MKKEILTKKEVKRLMGIPCRTRGEQISYFKKEIIKKEGEAGVKKFEQEINKFGYPFSFSEINDMDWYPVGLRTICLITLKNSFNFKDEDFIRMGSETIGNSIVVKLFFKYFSSRETAFKYVPGYWRKVCTCGRAEAIKLVQTPDGKKGHFTVRLYDFDFHPLHCKGQLGSFLQLAKLLGGKNAKIEEKKCMHRGDPYHEFFITWE